MEFSHPPLKLNKDKSWPRLFSGPNIFGLDINPEYCCAALAGEPTDGVIPTQLNDIFYDDSREEYVSRIPTVLALDKEDPSRGRIGYEGEQYAEENGCTLYRDFLMVPDQRADVHYHNDSSQPTYRKLMDIFLYELLSELSGGYIFVALPDDPDWRQHHAFFADFLREVSHRWDEQSPESDLFSKFYLLDPSGAREAYRLNEPEAPADDPHALCKGLAVCGSLLQQRADLLYRTEQMLQEAFPWAWAWFRDAMHGTVGLILHHKLDSCISQWSKFSQTSQSFRDMLSSTFCGPFFNTSALNSQESHLRDNALSTIHYSLPSTGSDPADHPDVLRGIAPTFIGSKWFYNRLTSMAFGEFLDFYPWAPGFAQVDPIPYAYIRPEQGPEIIHFFFSEIKHFIPDESVFFGPFKSLKLSFSGVLDNPLPSQEIRQELLALITSRKYQIIKDINWKIYNHTQAWDKLSRYLFQHIYDRQLLMLNSSLGFITTPTPPTPPEEGVLI